MFRCKAREIREIRRTDLYAAVTQDERNAADEPFSTARHDSSLPGEPT